MYQRNFGDSRLDLSWLETDQEPAKFTQEKMQLTCSVCVCVCAHSCTCTFHLPLSSLIQSTDHPTSPPSTGPVKGHLTSTECPNVCPAVVKREGERERFSPFGNRTHRKWKREKSLSLSHTHTQVESEWHSPLGPVCVPKRVNQWKVSKSKCKVNWNSNSNSPDGASAMYHKWLDSPSDSVLYPHFQTHQLNDQMECRWNGKSKMHQGIFLLFRNRISLSLSPAAANVNCVNTNRTKSEFKVSEK